MVIPKKRSDKEIQEAQEVINKNRFIYQTNQSLQNLKQGIVALNIENDKTRALASSDNKALMISFENLKEDIIHRVKAMESRVGDIASEVSDIRLKIEDLLEDVKDQRENIEECRTFVRSSVVDRISALEDRVSISRRDCERAIEALKIQVKEQLYLMNVALTPKQGVAQEEAEARIDRVIKVWKVDFDGLVKEIGLLKKSTAYGEKKFENIYTLIDRLKEKLP